MSMCAEYYKLFYNFAVFDLSSLTLGINCLFTGSIASSEKRRCISYSEADFEVFRPDGAAPDFTPIGGTIRV